MSKICVKVCSFPAMGLKGISLKYNRNMWKPFFMLLRLILRISLTIKGIISKTLFYGKKLLNLLYLHPCRPSTIIQYITMIQGGGVHVAMRGFKEYQAKLLY